MKYKIDGGERSPIITFTFDEGEYLQIKSISFGASPFKYSNINSQIYDSIGANMISLTSDNNAKKLLAYTRMKRAGANAKQMAEAAKNSTLQPNRSLLWCEKREATGETEMIARFDFLTIQDLADNLVRGQPFLKDFENNVAPKGWV